MLVDVYVYKVGVEMWLSESYQAIKDKTEFDCELLDPYRNAFVCDGGTHTMFIDFIKQLNDEGVITETPFRLGVFLEKIDDKDGKNERCPRKWIGL